MGRLIQIKTVVLLLVITFQFISCDKATDAIEEATKGSLEVTTETSGEDIDDDGYMLVFDDQEVSLPANGTTVIEDLDPNTYQAELNGLAENCTVGGSNSPEFEFVILPSETIPLNIEVTCESQSQT